VTVEMVMAELVASAETSVSCSRTTRGHEYDEFTVLAKQRSPIPRGQIGLVRVEDSLLLTDILRIDGKDAYATFLEYCSGCTATPSDVTAL